jgi:hypothetical protein
MLRDHVIMIYASYAVSGEPGLFPDHQQDDAGPDRQDRRQRGQNKQPIDNIRLGAAVGLCCAIIKHRMPVGTVSVFRHFLSAIRPICSS